MHESKGARFLGLAAVANDLGESAETVRKWVMDGRLGPMLKLPSENWKILREDYEHWLESLVVDRRGEF